MSRTGRVAVIINPISGTGGNLDVARERARRAAAAIERHGLEGPIFLTQHAGHARELAAAARAQGATTIVAWGGDGTVNEVGSALAFGDARLAIVPSGSGNGLARELGVPFDPDGAFAVAFEGQERVIDAGELDGRLFFNIAGIGLDAQVAHRFAEAGRRRGLARYAAITAHELFTYRPQHHTIVTDGHAVRVRTLIIAIANARQYGNGALIAPQARLDDGRLDVVVVEARSPMRALAQVPVVFMGRIGTLRGVSMRAADEIRISDGHPLLYHVDGEPGTANGAVEARVRPAALTVMTPRLR